MSVLQTLRQRMQRKNKDGLLSRPSYQDIPTTAPEATSPMGKIRKDMRLQNQRNQTKPAAKSLRVGPQTEATIPDLRAIVQRELDNITGELDALEKEYPSKVYAALSQKADLDVDVPVLGPAATGSTLQKETADYNTRKAALQKKQKALNDEMSVIDDYLTEVEKAQTYQEMASMDIEMARSEADALAAAFENYKAIDTVAQNLLLINPEGPISGQYLQLRHELDKLNAQYGVKNRKEFEALLTAKNQKINQAERIQSYLALISVADPTSDKYDPQFYEKSGYVSTATEDGWGGDMDTGYTDAVYEFINGNLSISPYIVGKYEYYDFITEAEKRLYNYYHLEDRENGTDLAQQYLDFLREELRDRGSDVEYKKYEGKLIPELLYGIKAGISGFGNDVNNWYLGREGYIPATATELTSAKIRDDLGDTGPSWYNTETEEWENEILGSSLAQWTYDAITSTSRMVPAIATSTMVGMVNPTAGTYAANIMMSAASAGSAYRDKLNQGYSPEQAKLYGTLVGASEGVLNQSLGGISKLGGVGVKTALSNLSAVDDVLAQFAASSVGHKGAALASEFSEEYIQAFLEPYIWQAVSGEAVTQDWQNNLYSGLQGLIGASVFESGSQAIEQLSDSFDDYGSPVQFSFGATQESIEAYVDAAYTMSNTQSYKKYATVSEQLSRDVADEVDLNGYAHALRDNDIRHIRNSHGERTAEKYPVTKEDIKNIPWLVQNYDKVLAVKRTDGKTGIVYVKAMPNGLVYYLEQVTSVYGNEPLLINKQMIKTGMEDIPDLKGLREAITKKQSETEFLDDLKQAPQVYAQSVRQFHSSNSIADGNQDVKQGTEQSTTSMTNREALAWVLENKELQRIDPRTRTILQEYGRHLQQLQKIRDLQSQLQVTGTDASTSQPAQRNVVKLEQLYARHEKRLTQLEKNPRLQRLAQQTLTDLAPSETETVELSQNDDVDITRTYDRIDGDSASTEGPEPADTVYQRRVKTLQRNRAAGKRAETKLYAIFSKTMVGLERQITIKINGEEIRIRADAIGFEESSTGERKLKILEFKASKTAPLTKNQREGFPVLTEKGGVVVGNKRCGTLFPDGYVIEPGVVIEVIRINEGGGWYVSGRFG